MTIEFNLTVVDPKVFLKYMGVTDSTDPEEYHDWLWYISTFRAVPPVDLKPDKVGLEIELGDIDYVY